MRLSIGAGGVRVFGFVPALRQLASIPSVVGGVSMGAVVATLLAVGYSADDIALIFVTVDVQRLILDDRLSELVGALLEGKGVPRGATVSAVPGLHIAVGNLSRHCPQLADGDMPLVLALRAATAIPVVFPSVEWRGDTLVDAAVYIDSLEELVPGPWRSFIIADPPDQGPADGHEMKFPDFAGRLMVTAARWRLRRFLEGATGPVHLLESAVGTFELGLTADEKRALVAGE